VPPAEPAAADAAASGAPAEAHPATPAAAADSGAPPASTAAGAAAPNSDASPTAAPPAEEAPAVAEAAPAAAPANAEDTPGASASAGAGTQPQSRGQLHFVFEDESWVEVRERGGKIIFSRLNPAGTEEEVAGEPPLELVIGNADSVRLTYDGDPVDLAPHTRVDVARFALP
jgi:cytoskeleton protein RodZ